MSLGYVYSQKLKVHFYSFESKCSSVLFFPLNFHPLKSRQSPTSFESEKDALMKQLQNSGDQFSAARERQAMLVKLRLEKKRLDQQGTFDQAALILGQANTLGER